MPAFVVLSHTYSKNRPDRESVGTHDHFDLMIQDGNQLATWRLAEWPVEKEHQVVVELPPHRIAYLDYEGPLSGDRGQVIQVEKGTFKILNQTDSLWSVVLQGASFAGTLHIGRVRNENRLARGNDQGEPNGASALWDLYLVKRSDVAVESS